MEKNADAIEKYENAVIKLNNLKASDKGTGKKSNEIQEQQKVVDKLKQNADEAKDKLVELFNIDVNNPDVSKSAGSIKPEAPNMIRQIMPIPRPAKAGVCLSAFSHWSIKMITNRAVMQKSMPSISHGISCPNIPPKTEPIIQ